MSKNLIQILSIFISFCLILEQSVFAQTIDLSHYFVHNSNQNICRGDKFRPLHLRYISYDNQANDFKVLLDKGDFFNQKTEKTLELEQTTQELMKYFFVGLALPNEKFWVNLRPDSPDNILDPELEKTDIGRIFLEADLQLKKDTASFTSPQTKEGKEYWDKLYKKAGELFGAENITIPTITRPWIVPNEIIIREAPDNAYIYKATLKVMLEEDYLKSYQQYTFNDPRLKELNEYSTKLIKETIIPKLTYAVNTSKRYAPLRQVYYSLILAQWFKQKYGSSGSIRAPVNSYIDLIDSGNLANIALNQPYDKQDYFQQYQKSFADGEYNLQEPVYTPVGQSVRRYMSGGIGPFECSSAINKGEIKAKNPLSLPPANPGYILPPMKIKGYGFKKEELPFLTDEEHLMRIKEIITDKGDSKIKIEALTILSDELTKIESSGGYSQSSRPLAKNTFDVLLELIPVLEKNVLDTQSEYELRQDSLRILKFGAGSNSATWEAAALALEQIIKKIEEKALGQTAIEILTESCKTYDHVPFYRVLGRSMREIYNFVFDSRKEYKKISLNALERFTHWSGGMHRELGNEGVLIDAVINGMESYLKEIFLDKQNEMFREKILAILTNMPKRQSAVTVLNELCPFLERMIKIEQDERLVKQIVKALCVIAFSSGQESTIHILNDILRRKGSAELKKVIISDTCGNASNEFPTAFNVFERFFLPFKEFIFSAQESARSKEFIIDALVRSAEKHPAVKGLLKEIISSSELDKGLKIIMFASIDHNVSRNSTVIIPILEQVIKENRDPFVMAETIKIFNRIMREYYNDTYYDDVETLALIEKATRQLKSVLMVIIRESENYELRWQAALLLAYGMRDENEGKRDGFNKFIADLIEANIDMPALEVWRKYAIGIDKIADFLSFYEEILFDNRANGITGQGLFYTRLLKKLFGTISRNLSASLTSSGLHNYF